MMELREAGRAQIVNHVDDSVLTGLREVIEIVDDVVRTANGAVQIGLKQMVNLIMRQPLRASSYMLVVG